MEDKLVQKYRPRKIEDIVGQEHIKKSIINSVKFNRIFNAYLLAGMKGTGKTSLARIMAMILNCEDGPKLEYNIEERVCRSIINETCPDVEELDAAANNSVENITEIIRRSYSSPIVGKKKIFIIDECLPYDSIIKTDINNSKKIGDIVSSDKEECVLSYNTKKRKLERKKVIRKIKIPNNKRMKEITVKLKNGEIKKMRITENHSIYNESFEKIKCKNLKIGDKLNILKK